MPYNIPNSLTLLRIGLIPVFVICFLLPDSWAWTNEAATIVFVLAAFTDWLDGYMARKLKQFTAFGAFLDPVADKLIVATALILLVDANPTPFHGAFLALPAAVVIGREIAISALREWMAEIGERTQVAVSVIGKIKTSAQMVAIGFLIYQEPLGNLPIPEIGLFLLYVAAILTLWSMYLYLRAAWPVLTATENHK